MCQLQFFQLVDQLLFQPSPVVPLSDGSNLPDLLVDRVIPLPSFQQLVLVHLGLAKAFRALVLTLL